MGAIFLFLGWCIHLSLVEGKTPRFRGDAESFMDAGFRTCVRRRGGLQKDFTKIEVTARPLRMVETPLDIDANRVSIEIKSGEGMWTVIDGEPSKRGGVYKWTEPGVEPCLEHRVRIWVHGEVARISFFGSCNKIKIQGTEQAVFELPTVIPRASSAELVASQFTPHRPSQLQVGEVGEESFEVSWEVSSCAEMYDVTYEKVSAGEESFSQQVRGGRVRLEDLDSCSEYEVRVSAILGEQYSEEVTMLVSTAPGFYAAERLNPVMTPSMNSLKATWKAFEKLSCVKKYLVAVCKEGSACPEGLEVFRDDAMSEMAFASGTTLDQCSDYTLHITPIFKEKSLDERIVQFRTLSQPVEDVANLLTSVEAEAGEEQMITVKWNAIKCASQYEVFQKINTFDGEWEKIGTSKENVFQSKGAPCMEYKYGVKVTIDDQVSEVVEFNEAIMTKIDTSVPYVAANLAIDPTSDGAHLTWDHGKCIKSYKIRTCQLPDTCYEEVMILKDPNQHKMQRSLRNLRPCSSYRLEIFPMTEDNEELAAEPRTFTTASPPASPPQEVSVSLNELTNKVDIRWSKVQCAQGYRIHQTLGNSGTKTAWDSEGLSVNLESPEPCVTYSYGVSAIMDGKESKPTAFQAVHVPPRIGSLEQPVLVIEERVNNSVTLRINNADKNHHCKVSQYEVRCGSQLQHFNAASLVDGKIVIEVGDEETKIEGRILYQEFDTWSPWISSDSPRHEAFGAEMDRLVLPIVVGAIAAFTLLLLLTVLIVKKKKSQLKYDAEKLEGHSDESQKLKTEETFTSTR